MPGVCKTDETIKTAPQALIKGDCMVENFRMPKGK